MDELRLCLHTLFTSGLRFAGLYVVPPNIVMLCSYDTSVLTAMDTHTVLKTCGGDNKHGVVVTSLHPSTAIPAITNWLFLRLCPDNTVTHEFTLLSPVNAVVKKSTQSAAESSLPSSSTVEAQHIVLCFVVLELCHPKVAVRSDVATY